MGSIDKAKPSVRVGRKATGLAGEAPELPRFARQPGCRSEQVTWLSFFCGAKMHLFPRSYWVWMVKKKF